MSKAPVIVNVGSVTLSSRTRFADAPVGKVDVAVANVPGKKAGAQSSLKGDPLFQVESPLAAQGQLVTVTALYC